MFPSSKQDLPPASAYIQETLDRIRARVTTSDLLTHVVTTLSTVIDGTIDPTARARVFAGVPTSRLKEGGAFFTDPVIMAAVTGDLLGGITSMFEDTFNIIARDDVEYSQLLGVFAVSDPEELITTVSSQLSAMYPALVANEPVLRAIRQDIINYAIMKVVTMMGGSPDGEDSEEEGTLDARDQWVFSPPTTVH